MFLDSVIGYGGTGVVPPHCRLAKNVIFQSSAGNVGRSTLAGDAHTGRLWCNNEDGPYD